MAGYYWPELRSPNPDWAAIAAAFQPAVMSRTAGRSLSSYRTLADGVTESRFDDLSVVANWNANSTYSTDGFSIAPSGCLARTDDGSVVAGVFVDTFQGTALGKGVHYLVIERRAGAVLVRQPGGPDTSIAIALPSDWDLSNGVMVQAVNRDNQPIATAPATVSGSQASFLYMRSLAGVPVDRYEVSPVGQAGHRFRRRVLLYREESASARSASQVCRGSSHFPNNTVRTSDRSSQPLCYSYCFVPFQLF